MTEKHVRQGGSAVDREIAACEDAQAPHARSGYARPTVVKIRLDNIVRGGVGTALDSSHTFTPT
ncbi:MAG: hypothetical protein ABR961_10810 [Thermoanaerobaculaceae bacterium]|jgi:hypothetical protein